ncbi:radial spoke head protein 3 homolog [Tiliqua scincoides]|uniref:radial spoke head protein 3 homolog n=1 Tax=Tiliqua scincoides TaxID=71010 RepID=UPI003463363A
MTSGSILFSQEGASVPSRTYSYFSRPRALPVRRRYRSTTPETSDHEGSVRYGNLMYDRRVVRGNTYAQRTLPWSSEPNLVEMQKQREAHRKMLARKRAKDELDTETLAPEIIESRLRVDVQTELYLEEIADRIIEVDNECQTDEFLARPATPLFIPEKTGVDVATQIEEGELFDFNIEVKPILEVLVGKTIEQALLEVTEEEDLLNLKAYQNAYHELRNAEMAEVQRLEEQERRHREEKDRRMVQQYDQNETEKEVSEKIAARAFAMEYLTDLIPSVFSHLQNTGFFYDIVERDIEDGFLPYLMNKVQQNMMRRLLGRDMLECLVREVAGKRLKDFVTYEKLRRRRSPKRDPFKVFGSTSSTRRSSGVPGEIHLRKSHKSGIKGPKQQ